MMGAGAGILASGGAMGLAGAFGAVSVPVIVPAAAGAWVGSRLLKKLEDHFHAKHMEKIKATARMYSAYESTPDSETEDQEIQDLRSGIF